MHIHYFGLSSFKFITKDATVITDPYDKSSGLTPPRGNADLIILSEKQNELYSNITSISGQPFLASDPGEYDVKGVTIAGIPLKQDKTYVTAFLIESEDLKILNLAHIKEFTMEEDDLDGLGDIDILILPVGGDTVMSASTAAKIANDIEPKIIIPSHYATDGLKMKLDTVDKFIKELGSKPETLDKLLIKRKDLPLEGMKLVILEPMR